jgi:hypothetical protein
MTLGGAAVGGAAAAGRTGTPGRTDVTLRALERAVTAIAAEQLRVPARDVRVELVDEKGALGIAITAPVRLPPLDDPRGARLIARSREAREGIRSAATVMIDRTIGAVSIRLNRAVVLHERRVR